jgi:hypothetical protein
VHRRLTQLFTIGLGLWSLAGQGIFDGPVRIQSMNPTEQAHADSDIDLMITAPDLWLAQQDRFALLAELFKPSSARFRLGCA